MRRVEDSPEVTARFESNLDIVSVIARHIGRVVGRHAEHEDLVGYGREGLLMAARRFDPDRGIPFRSYANFRVRGAILDGVRTMGRLPRRTYERLNGLAAASRYSEGAAESAQPPGKPEERQRLADQALGEHMAAMATAMAVGMLPTAVRDEEGAITGAARDEDPEMATGKAELWALVRRGIEELPFEEAELVRRHYLEGEQFGQVAKDLNLSPSWASRLHVRAIRRLEKRLRSTAL